MSIKYWECKYNNLTQKGQIANCGKPDEQNFIHPCPGPNQNGDYCTKGEPREGVDEREAHLS